MANKLRSSLSSLWIIIWVSSVVILLSIGTWTKEQLTENIWSMATNSVTITSSNNNASAWAKKLPLTDETKLFLENNFPELSGTIATLKVASNQTAVYWTNSSSSTVNGISNNYFTLSKQELKYGTGFSQDDYDMKNPVVVLNYGSLSELFDDQNPVWQSIKIKGKRFTVVWILDQTSIESMGRGWSVTAYIPFPTFQEEINIGNEYDNFVVYLPNDSDNDTWKQIIHYALLKKLWLNNVNQWDFSVNSFASFLETLESTITVFTYFLWAIGAISLLVWGIGVMNIMIVSVTERTREIGIRKAIWALKRDIIMQFLTESVVITFLWWIIAIIFSYLVVYGINILISTMWSSSSSGPISIHLSITSDVVLLAFWLTALTWIWFGILPAKKAVQLKTIDALRFE